MMTLYFIEYKMKDFWNNSLIFLILIAAVSLIIRFYFFPNYPLTLDSLQYFFFASDISIQGKLPENYAMANSGWSIFLSVFFSLIKFDDVISYMHLQRTLSIILSTLTIIPIFFFCKNYFDKKLALIGASIFAFEPRLIQNSLLGIADPLYILLVAITLAMFFGSRKMMYLSFAISSLATIVRSEGFVLLLAISIMFFIRFKHERKEYPKLVMAIGIYMLILIPVLLYQIEIHGNDQVFSRAADSIEGYVGTSENSKPRVLFETGLENFSKYFVWNLIPIFIFFVPFGVYFMIKEWNSKNLMIIVGMFSLSLPAFWAYSIPLQETRYLYFLYPFLIIISLFTIAKFRKRKFFNIISSLILGGVLLSSLIFLSIKIDNEHEIEAYTISKIIATKVNVINSLTPESKYLVVVDYPERWSDFILYFNIERQNQKSILESTPQSIVLINSEDYNNINELINTNPKLTHIITDDSSNRKSYLKQIFKNENDFPYLIKEFDSKDNGFKYHVKLFKIDHEKFNLLHSN